MKSREQKRRWANSCKDFISNCKRSASISNIPYKDWLRGDMKLANWIIETIWELSVRCVGSINVSQSKPTNGKCEPTLQRAHFNKKKID